jgi:uncharacterized iron-regulated membrane protein
MKKKIVRKIHLWLSVPFGLILTLVCFSGAMLVFENEITEAVRPTLYHQEVPANARPLSLDSLMQRVEATLPDSVSITGVSIAADATRPYLFQLSQPRRTSLAVNPYSGEILGRTDRLPFFTTMFRLHRWLLDTMKPGNDVFVGKIVVGISVLAFVFVLLSGLVIWWPKTRQALKARLTIPLRSGGFRFWHGLHVAGGVYALLFLLAMALTGLTWSFPWYNKAFYALCGAQAESGGHGEGRGGHGGDFHKGFEQKGRHGQQDARPNGAPEGRREHDGQRPEDDRRRGEGRPAHHEEAAAKTTETTTAAATDAAEHGEGHEEARGEHPHHGGEDGYTGATTGDGHWEHPHGRRPHDEGDRPDSLRAEDDRHHGEHPRHNDEEGTAGTADAHREHRHGRRPEGAPQRPTDAQRTTAATDDHRQGDTLAAAPVSEQLDTLSPYRYWQQAYDAVRRHEPTALLTVSDGRIQVGGATTGNVRRSDSYAFDTATGRLTTQEHYADSKRAQKVRGWIFSVHTGAFGGFVMRLLFFLSALLGATLPLTGYYLWIRRLRRRRKS